MTGDRPPATGARPPEGYGDGLPILLAYQARWIDDGASIAVVEKARRIGLSWADASQRVLHAAAGGGDVYYMSYNKDMTAGYIADCAAWARRLGHAASEVLSETIIDGERQIQRYSIRLSSGRHIYALPSAPRVIRSRGRPGDQLIIDEVALCDDLDELLKAAVAVTQWGGQVRLISTHDGADNPFAALVEDVRAGRLPYALHRITLDDAIADGLARRVCTIRGDEWHEGYAAEWRAAQIARYRYPEHADEELFCVPLQGEGAWLSRALIESRMHDAPVLRYAGTAAFGALPEPVRAAEVQDWIEEQLPALLAGCDEDERHVVGVDFARQHDMTVMLPLAIERQLRRRCPGLIEMRNVPHRQQAQVLRALCDRLPRFAGVALDAQGNGNWLAEEAVDHYGTRAEGVMPTEAWYREHMPPYRAAWQDDMIRLPRSDDVVDDHRAIRIVRGVARLPAGHTDRRGERHGDSAIAGALAWYASTHLDGEISYRPVVLDPPATGHRSLATDDGLPQPGWSAYAPRARWGTGAPC